MFDKIFYENFLQIICNKKYILKYILKYIYMYIFLNIYFKIYIRRDTHIHDKYRVFWLLCFFSQTNNGEYYQSRYHNKTDDDHFAVNDHRYYDRHGTSGTDGDSQYVRLQTRLILKYCTAGLRCNITASAHYARIKKNWIVPTFSWVTGIVILD